MSTHYLAVNTLMHPPGRRTHAMLQLTHAGHSLADSQQLESIAAVLPITEGRHDRRYSAVDQWTQHAPLLCMRRECTQPLWTRRPYAHINTQVQPPLQQTRWFSSRMCYACAQRMRDTITNVPLSFVLWNKAINQSNHH